MERRCREPSQALQIEPVDLPAEATILPSRDSIRQGPHAASWSQRHWQEKSVAAGGGGFWTGLRLLKQRCYLPIWIVSDIQRSAGIWGSGRHPGRPSGLIMMLSPCQAVGHEQYKTFKASNQSAYCPLRRCTKRIPHTFDLIVPLAGTAPRWQQCWACSRSRATPPMVPLLMIAAAAMRLPDLHTWNHICNCDSVAIRKHYDVSGIWWPESTYCCRPVEVRSGIRAAKRPWLRVV